MEDAMDDHSSGKTHRSRLERDGDLSAMFSQAEFFSEDASSFYHTGQTSKQPGKERSTDSAQTLSFSNLCLSDPHKGQKPRRPESDSTPRFTGAMAEMTPSFSAGMTSQIPSFDVSKTSLTGLSSQVPAFDVSETMTSSMVPWPFVPDPQIRQANPWSDASRGSHTFTPEPTLPTRYSRELKAEGTTTDLHQVNEASAVTPTNRHSTYLTPAVPPPDTDMPSLPSAERSDLPQPGMTTTPSAERLEEMSSASSSSSPSPPLSPSMLLPTEEDLDEENCGLDVFGDLENDLYLEIRVLHEIGYERQGHEIQESDMMGADLQASSCEDARDSFHPYCDKQEGLDILGDLQDDLSLEKCMLHESVCEGQGLVVENFKTEVADSPLSVREEKQNLCFRPNCEQTRDVSSQYCEQGHERSNPNSKENQVRVSLHHDALQQLPASQNQTQTSTGPVSNPQTLSPATELVSASPTAAATDGQRGNLDLDSLTLPPCRVCGGRASGLHYGVNSCDACKGFFRRSLKRRRPYKCVGQKQCEIRHQRRIQCGYCRYQQCLSVGMSKHAIKIGRYTIHRRAHNMDELTRLQENARKQETPLDDAQVAAILEELMTAGKNSLHSTEDYSPEEVLRKQQLYAQEYQARMEQTKSSSAESKGMPKSTDTHLDKKKQFAEIHAMDMERYVRRYIRFGKGVPGFKSLSLDDQGDLLKTARMAIWFLGSYKGYNGDLKVIHLPNGRCMHFDEVDDVIGHNHMNDQAELAVRMRRYNFTPEEMIVLKAICLMSADRCPLQEPQKVEEYQWLLVRCLLKLFEKVCPGQKGRRFARATEVLVMCRQLSHLTDAAKYVDVIKRAYNKHQLLDEVILMCP